MAGAAMSSGPELQGERAVLTVQQRTAQLDRTLRLELVEIDLAALVREARRSRAALVEIGDARVDLEGTREGRDLDVCWCINL